jgi:hypothetical protein
MIDVWNVLANGLWILGLAILLATASWAHWIAGLCGTRLCTVLGRPPTWRTLSLGILLFCAGMAGTGRTWWERAVWVVLAATWVVQDWLS